MTSQHEQSYDYDGVASLTHEIRLLVEMVAEHASPWLDSILAAGHGSGFGAGSPGTGGDEGPFGAGESGWCPLCAVIAIVRGERPEFAARLAEQMARLVALLRAVLADRWSPEGGVHMPGFVPPDQPFGTSTPDGDLRGRRQEEQARVQHIPVRRRGAEPSGSVGER
ncbi:hypothetical protein H0B56_05235 [Haloechinothrix sp. YIM 98757]|uniref:Uncharacterized protein n=1 Tax=Haloechinothrix aidingensis TaxID=2752311 RepID=A0A838A8S4_9PSEU|nr:hypothetical protein [Haloechinothrix aidingensis]MBA0124941.1 hypothetical protein [Haloechinothrix aidingensis]